MISLAGFWLWPWAIWHLFWITGFMGSAFLGFDPFVWFEWLYVCFAPLELIGAYDLQNDQGRERAKTLSQWRQFVAQKAKPGSSSWLGWKAVAGGSGILDAAVVGMLVQRNLESLGNWSWAIAGIFFVTVALYLIPHFGWSELTDRAT